MKLPIAREPTRLMLVAAVMHAKSVKAEAPAMAGKCPISGHLWNDRCTFCSPEGERYLVAGDIWCS
jgi:hypothetical protein